MNISKKFDRVKQWTGEKMGQEAKTGVSDEFKALELEMQLRHEGMEKLQKSMTVYVKSISTRHESGDREKLLPVAHMGQTMINHGEDFEPDSEFGNCLIAMGRTNEKISRNQDTYVVNATSSWLESLERSLAMMKEYQAARKKLDQRRLAYDASLSKMQKAKKEDFRVEEELRSQKAKYEESNEDVYRRMQDIKEAEADTIQDLTTFVEVELEYYDRCRDELLKLKKDWPASNSPSQPRQQPSRRHEPRARSNTAQSASENRRSAYDEPIPEIEIDQPRGSIRSGNRVPSGTRVPSNSRIGSRNQQQEDYSPPSSPARPGVGRSATFQGPVGHWVKEERSPRMNSVPTPSSSEVGSFRANLRPTNGRTNIITADAFNGDRSDDGNSPDRDLVYGSARSVSPATSHGSLRSASMGAGPGKRAPPPPPSRAKKPIAPPPPMKRSDMSVGGGR